MSMLEKLAFPERGNMTDAEYIEILEGKLHRATRFVEHLTGRLRRIDKIAKEQPILIERIPEDYDVRDFITDVQRETADYPYDRELKPDSVVRLYQMSGRGFKDKAFWAEWRALREDLLASSKR